MEKETRNLKRHSGNEHEKGAPGHGAPDDLIHMRQLTASVKSNDSSLKEM